MKLTNLIRSLADYEPSDAKFISVYLGERENEGGPEATRIWLKNEMAAAENEFEPDSDEWSRYREVTERIEEFLDSERDESASGVAIFASLADDSLFETLQLDEPFPNNRFFMFGRPHIYPLARIVDQNPKYAVLWADTNKADIYIFGGENHLDVETETRAKVEEIHNDKTRGTKVGGWSQARYQRHVGNFHLQHAKETVEELERLMKQANVQHLVLCGDEATIMPVLRPQLSKETEDRVITALNMSQYASEEEIREKTHEAVRMHTAERDLACVERVVGAAKAAAGLGTLGVEETLAALSNGQVEELVLSSVFEHINYSPKRVEKVLDAYAPGDDNSGSEELPEASEKRQIADELLVRAMNSAARITFVEEDTLLKEAGGVGAVLRYNMNATASV
jgi:peptide chain release factor subunit 1